MHRIEKFFGNFSKPFDMQFGRLVTRIRGLEETIEKDFYAGAAVVQVYQSRSLAGHKIDLPLRREYNEARLSGEPAAVLQWMIPPFLMRYTS